MVEYIILGIFIASYRVFERFLAYNCVKLIQYVKKKKTTSMPNLI